MNVDRPALIALLLFGLLGLAFAVFGLGMLRQPPFPSDAPKPKVESGLTNPEMLPAPREVAAAVRSVQCSVSAPGLALEEIERQIAVPLELKLQSLDGQASILTRIESGSCSLTINLTQAAVVERTRSEMMLSINELIPQLPQGVLPRVEQRDRNELPVLWLTIRDGGQRTLLQHSDVLNQIVRPRLLTIAGVRDVELRGESRRQMQVITSPDRLLAYDLSMVEITDAIGKGNIALIKEAVKDLENTAVSAKNGTPIFLRDIAKIVDSAESVSTARIEDRRAVLMGVHVKPNANAREVAEAVRARMETINLPPDLKLEIVADATRAGAADLIVVIETPAGTTREAIDKMVHEMIGEIRKQLPKDEVATILSMGQSQPESTATHLLLSLAPNRKVDVEEVAKRIRTAANEFPGVRTRTLVLPASSFPQRIEFPIRIRIVGDDLDVLQHSAREILRLAGEQVSGLVDLGDTEQGRMPALHFAPDRQKAARYGLTIRDIVDAYEMANGKRTVPVKDGSIVLVLGNQRTSPDEIGKLPIRTKDGQAVPLGQVAHLQIIESLTVLERFNGQRCVTITANPAPGISVETATANLRKIANESLPAKYRLIDD